MEHHHQAWVSSGDDQPLPGPGRHLAKRLWSSYLRFAAAQPNVCRQADTHLVIQRLICQCDFSEMPFHQMIMGASVLGIADGPTEVHKVTVARQVLRGPSTRSIWNTR